MAKLRNIYFTRHEPSDKDNVIELVYKNGEVRLIYISEIEDQLVIVDKIERLIEYINKDLNG